MILLRTTSAYKGLGASMNSEMSEIVYLSLLPFKNIKKDSTLFYNSFLVQPVKFFILLRKVFCRICRSHVCN